MKPFKCNGFFFERNTFQKICKVFKESPFSPKYFGAFIKKKLPLFDKSLMTLENFHQKKLTFKGMRFHAMFGSNHKKVFGKLIKRSPYLSPIWIN